MRRTLVIIASLIAAHASADVYEQTFGSSKYENKTIYLQSGGSVTHTFRINGVFGNSVNSFRTDWYSTEDIQGSAGFIESDSSNFGNGYWDPEVTRTYSAAGTYFARGEVMTRDYAWQDFWWKETHQWRITVVVDTTGPTWSSGSVDLDAADDTGRYNNDNVTRNTSGLTFSWPSATDSQIGLDRYEWRLGTSGAWNNRNLNTSVDISAGEGSYTFYVRAVDKAGNASSEKSLSFKVDTTRPNVPSLITPGHNTRTTDTTPYFDWSCSDNTGGSGIWQYDLVVERPWGWNVLDKSGITSSDYAPSSSEALGAGGEDYDWRVRSYDVAGNVSADWSSENRFYIDDRVGSVRVDITPASAVSAGAKWQLSGYDSTWRDSGTSVTVSEGSYTIKFNDVSTWEKPADIPITLTESGVQQSGTYKRPDLIVEDVWTVPSTIYRGDSFVIKAKVKNVGDGSAHDYNPLWQANIYTRFYLDGVDKGETDAVESGLNHEIPAGESRIYTSASLTAPSSASILIKALADSQNDVSNEHHEDNNSREESVSVLIPTGSIQATLNNWNGTPASGANTKFIRYNGGTPIPLVGSNPDTFTGVPVGNHWVEGYQKNPTWNEYEYWGAVEAAVTLNNTAPAVINRHTPYCEDFWFEYNGNRVEALNKVPPGSTVIAKATIRNKDTSVSSRTIRLNAWWRYGASGSGTAIPAVTTTIGPNTTKTVTLGNVALSATENDVYAYIKTYAVFSDPNNPALTDAWDWAKKFEATTGSRPTVANITIRDLDGQGVYGITPGKRYAITADFTDVDGQGDLTYCVAALVNSADGREIALTYHPANGTMGIGSGGLPQLPMPLQDSYAALTHVEKTPISNGYRIRYIFWLTAKWAVSTDGVDVIGRGFDAASHQTDLRAETNLDFAPLSLPAGKWTIIIHGKSNSDDNNFVIPGLGQGPWSWSQYSTEWFKGMSDPTAHTTRNPYDAWAWELGSKFNQISKTPVRIHRLGDREAFTLQTWRDSASRSAGYGSYDYASQSHNVLIFDWDDPSDYLDLDDWTEDNWYAHASGDALHALVYKLGIQDSIGTVIGYSRGGIVGSEFARRMRNDGKTGFQVVYLDAEGWGEFENELSAQQFSAGAVDFSSIKLAVDVAATVGGKYVGTLFEVVDMVGDWVLPSELEDWEADNAAELALLKDVLGFPYADYRFFGFDGLRVDQYRQAYSNPNKMFCGAEALSGGGNDQLVEAWPTYTTATNYPSVPASGSEGGELPHSFFPHYLTDWCYLAQDATQGNHVYVETPQLWKWKDQNSTWQSRTVLSYPTLQATTPENMTGYVFNSGARDGSAAGWTYHGGYAPFESWGVNGIEWVDASYEFQIAPGNGLSALRHNWQVSPSASSGVRFSVEHWDLLWETEDSLSVYWESSYRGTVYSGDVNSGPVTVTMPCAYPNAVGRLRFSPYFQAYDAEFLLDNIEFVGGSRPVVGTLTGNPSPVVQGANLRLVAGGVFDADGSVNEVRFYRDSNGNGVYDSGTDTSFGVSYSGSSGNWEVTQNTAGIPVGQHYFFALAKDSDGLWSAAVRSAASIEVTQPVNQAPTVGSLADSPDPVDRGADLTLIASSVADANGTVARVDFYHDANNNGVFDEGAGDKVGTDTTIVGSQASVTFGTGSLPAGTRRFFAVAYDNEDAASGPASCRTTIIQKWNLTYDEVSPAGSGTITESPVAGRYPDGTQIDPSASAAATYRFDHWEVNGVTKTMPVTLTADTTVKAVFVYNGPTVVPPVLNAIGNQSVNAGVAFSLTVTKQQGHTPITWTMESAPVGMTINTSGVISWPNPTPAGSSHFITVKAANSAGNDTESFTLYVLAPPDSTRPTVQITVPTASATYTSQTNRLSLAGTASDDVGIAQVTIRNCRDLGGYVCSGTTAWQFNGMPLYQGQNLISVVATDTSGNSATDTVTVAYSGDPFYDGELRSGAVVQEVQFPDNLVPGQTVTVRWKLLSYVPVRSCLDAGKWDAGAGAWTWGPRIKNGTCQGQEDSTWNISMSAYGRKYAATYAFECDWVVPNKPGDFQIWFNVAQMDGKQYMIATVPEGVDSRPDPTSSKVIVRTIAAGGTDANPQSEARFTDPEQQFDTLADSKKRSGGTVIGLTLPDNLTQGSQVTVEWTVMAYMDIDAEMSIVDFAVPTIVKDGIIGTRIADVASSYNFVFGGTRYYAREYTFRATFTVPNSPGDKQIYFRHRLRGDANSIWMSANIAPGVDTRAFLYNGMYGRFIERTINP